MKRTFAVVLFILTVVNSPGVAQERLETLAARGYVGEWLVCGPFSADVAGGIAASLDGGEKLLGDADPFAAAGGIARLRPKDGQTVEHEGDAAVWQTMTCDSPLLDFSSVFEGRDEGIVYAAFQTMANRPASLLLQLETPLGARVFLNGFPAREIVTGPIAVSGANVFLLTFRQGVNLVVFEAPVASLAALRTALSTTPAGLAGAIQSTRPLLPLRSGFELALQVNPVRAVHGVAVAPRLTGTGTFSRAQNDLQQDTILTLFNPQEHASPRMRLSVDVRGAAREVIVDVPSIAPGAGEEIIVPLPTNDASPGTNVPARLAFEAGGRTTNVDVAVRVLEAPARGTVYAIATTTGEEAPETRIETLRRTVLLAEREADQGFELGAVDDWWPPWIAAPEHRESLRAWAQVGRVASAPLFAHIDERLATPELLVKNLRLGARYSESVLQSRNGALVSPGSMAVLPQFAQLLTQSGIVGFVSDVPLAGLPGAGIVLSPNGDGVSARFQMASAQARSAIHLRQLAQAHRQALLRHGISDDVLMLGRSADNPSLWLGAAAALAQSAPRVSLNGLGPQEFFEAHPFALVPQSRRPASVGQLMTGYEPGSIVSQRPLKDAFYAAESAVSMAERFAALSAMLGASYPSAPIELAWRRLLFAAHPRRLGHARNNDDYWQTLAAAQEAHEIGQHIVGEALNYLAAQANTLAGAPEGLEAFGAVVVFNPLPQVRTDSVSTELAFNGVRGFTLVDGAGLAVPYFAEALQVRGTAIDRGRISFTAENVPGLGYKTFYLAAANGITASGKRDNPWIENDYFRVTVDPPGGGAITALHDKRHEIDLVDGEPWADLVALREDIAQTQDGRELFTSGDVQLASAGTASIEVTHTAAFERLVATVPFLGGKAVRTYTLYPGVARIHVELELIGVDVGERLIAVSIPANSNAIAPVYGERFGAVVGGRSAQRYDLRTDSGENLSATGAQVAYRWASFGPGDGVHDGAAFTPFGPTTIVYGSDASMRRAAEALQSALMRRGIPAETLPVEGSTRVDGVFHIVLGSESVNGFAARLDPQLSEDQRAKLGEASATEGTVLVVIDESGGASVPTLWITGDGLHHVSDRATEIAEAIRTSGRYHVPPTEVRDELDASEQGAAFVFAGTRLASLEPGGPALLFLEHGDSPVTSPKQGHAFAIVPMSGSWRTAGVVHEAAAYAEPLLASPTDLHLGALPSELSFLTTHAPNFVMTTVEARSDDGDAAIAVRGFETHGGDLAARFRFGGDLHRADGANILHHVDEPLPLSGDAFDLRGRPFEIATMILQPTSRARRGTAATLWTRPPDWGPAYTRYWTQGHGGGDLDTETVGLRVRGRIDDDTIEGEVLITNEQTALDARGIVTIQTPAGWSASPKEIVYNVGPGELAREGVFVLRDAGIATAASIAVETEWNGRVIRDVLSATPNPIRATVERGNGVLSIVVENRDGIRADGYVEILAPPGEWDAGARRKMLSVPPFREVELRFPWVDEKDSTGHAVRIGANNTAQVLAIP